ncbi:YkgJ family cysteine cluster protein [Nannocystis sp. ILAH1]|uniref:YkgJ family cysteine cluster protein n=1 Tax=unclassified Nannocystis TaxID=2627009 RepID=UPI002271F24E|nr:MULTISPECIES: YkgJ family cysteine cluster protein [unclassified Nannocystis]MCY0994115.1 YkgJ family cysteine cluster protein [Nannocystis sp. ILAH1]MCY1067079.1 YkgJ family cysteine cluster protein [Nannocystis sp. RBIL2]
MSLATLCQRCALCCDGDLFATVPLQPGEVEAVRRRGLVVLDRDAGPALAQPCAALQDRSCTIYDDRPGPCRSYECMLYAALAADEVGLAEALATVAEARARLTAVADALPGEGPALARARVAAREGHLSPETHALVVRASEFLERRFRGHTRR